MRISFETKAFEEYNEWARTDRKIFQRIVKLITEAQRTPEEGSGNPEKLKYDLSGHWSRRIDDKHRLVYRVENNEILHIVSCKNHYND